jgi:hypothetical protein
MIVLTAIVIIAFLVPKVNLYYQFEHAVKPYDIILSGEELKDKKLWLEINDASLYYQQIESARIKRIDVMFFVLYNRITAEHIRLASTLKDFVPLDISYVTLRYSILNPLKVLLESSGDFGELTGEFLLQERILNVKLYPSSIMTKRFQSTLSRLKQDSTGGYYYESRF